VTITTRRPPAISSATRQIGQRCDSLMPPAGSASQLTSRGARSPRRCSLGATPPTSGRSPGHVSHLARHALAPPWRAERQAIPLTEIADIARLIVFQARRDRSRTI
jgi:hypothetical protein